MLQQPDGSSTPLPPNPKSAQVESTSAQAGSLGPVQVPEYLHKFCKKVLQDWNTHFPYSHDDALLPFITKDQEKYSLNWDKATAKNISLLMIWSDEEKGGKSREQSPK